MSDREPVRLHPRQGDPFEGDALVVRASEGARVGKAVAIGVIGTLLGLGSIVIPVAHLVTTWAIPLASWAIAWAVYNARMTVREVRGHCPACDKDFQAEGGEYDEPMYVRCGGCGAPYRVGVG